MMGKQNGRMAGIFDENQFGLLQCLYRSLTDIVEIPDGSRNKKKGSGFAVHYHRIASFG